MHEKKIPKGCYVIREGELNVENCHAQGQGVRISNLGLRHVLNKWFPTNAMSGRIDVKAQGQWKLKVKVIIYHAKIKIL